MKKERTTLKELIERNKQELLKDSRVIEQIELRVEKRIQENTK